MNVVVPRVPAVTTKDLSFVDVAFNNGPMALSLSLPLFLFLSDCEDDDSRDNGACFSQRRFFSSPQLADSATFGLFAPRRPAFNCTARRTKTMDVANVSSPAVNIIIIINIAARRPFCPFRTFQNTSTAPLMNDLLIDRLIHASIHGAGRVGDHQVIKFSSYKLA